MSGAGELEKERGKAAHELLPGTKDGRACPSGAPLVLGEKMAVNRACGENAAEPRVRIVGDDPLMLSCGRHPYGMPCGEQTVVPGDERPVRPGIERQEGGAWLTGDGSSKPGSTGNRWSSMARGHAPCAEILAGKSAPEECPVCLAPGSAFRRVNPERYAPAPREWQAAGPAVTP